MLSFFRKSDETVSVSPSIIVFTVFFLLGLYFLFQIRAIVTLVFLAFIIMVAINPLVHLTTRRLRMPRILAIVLNYFLVITLLVATVAVVVPTLATEGYQLLKELNLPQIPVLQQELSELRISFNDIGTLFDRFGSSANMLFSVVTSTFSGVFTVFTLLVLSFYLMLERPYLHTKLAWFTKDKSLLDRAERFFNSLETQLGGWVRAQIILITVIGLITYIGLSLLSVPYALPLAILAGLLEILPNLGPTIAAIPSIVIAYATMGPVMAGVVALFYVVVQQLENSILVPKIMRDNVDVSPLVSIVSILVGLQLGGVVGALLAVPTYIVVRTVYGVWFRDTVRE